MVTISNEMKRHVIRELLTDGGNHREYVFQEINREFLRFAIEFLDRAGAAKLRWEDRVADQSGSGHWYLNEFTLTARTKSELGVIGGVPDKTVTNIYGSGTRETVAEAAATNLSHLLEEIETIGALRPHDAAVSLVLPNGLTFDTEESLLLVNSLAVKRDQIRAGYWASVGNGAEEPLMRTLSTLYGLQDEQFRSGLKKDGRYQVDFLIQHSGVECPCEVKLNGRGNPESVTAAIARNPRILLADHISSQNREKLDSMSIAWVDFSEDGGFRGFGRALRKFGFTFVEPQDLSDLDRIFDRILPLT